MTDDLFSLVIARTNGFTVVSFYEHWDDLDDKEVVELLKD